MRFLEYVWSSQSIYVIWFMPLILPWPATPWWCLLQLGGLPLHLLLLIQSKDDLLKQSAANLFPAEHSSFEESVQEPQRKTTFQCQLTIAAQEAEPTRERDEFKSKFAVQALSYATCPSDNTYFKVIQNFSKYFSAFRSNSRHFEIKLLPVQQASVWCLVLSYFYWKRDCWAPFSLPSFTA